MKFAITCVLLSAVACHQAPKQAANRSSAPVPHSEMRTIENIDPRPVVIDPPAVLREEAAPPKPTGQPWEVKPPVPLTAEDEKLRAALPFAPAIAMDPID